MRQRLEFSYRISDERLLAWARRPIIERLQMLDDLRRFTLAARAAPAVDIKAQNPEPGSAR
jgi:hypothetical protein